MDVVYFKEPIPHIIFKNLFSKVANKKIIDEVISYKDKFISSGVGGGVSKPNPSLRTNTVLYMDRLERKTSFFLTEIDRLFAENQDFRDILSSSPYPINEFLNTNTHETQVSRYGNEGQKYDWHIDSGEIHRKLSFVYYFWKEPKKFKGGIIELTSSPVFDGQTVERLSFSNAVSMIPVNNMAIVFGGKTAHRVTPTTSPTKFEDGRFSANVWIGFK